MSHTYLHFSTERSVAPILHSQICFRKQQIQCRSQSLPAKFQCYPFGNIQIQCRAPRVQIVCSELWKYVKSCPQNWNLFSCEILSDINEIWPKNVTAKSSSIWLKGITRKSINGGPPSFTRMRNRTVCKLDVAGRGFFFSFLQLQSQGRNFKGKIVPLIKFLNIVLFRTWLRK